MPANIIKTKNLYFIFLDFVRDDYGRHKPAGKVRRFANTILSKNKVHKTWNRENR
jgi:hypothetical protein